MLGIGSGSFDPETLVILETAFDEAWIALKTNGSGNIRPAGGNQCRATRPLSTAAVFLRSSAWQWSLTGPGPPGRATARNVLRDWNSVPVLVEGKGWGLRNVRGVPLPFVTTVSTTSNL